MDDLNETRLPTISPLFEQMMSPSSTTPLNLPNTPSAATLGSFGNFTDPNPQQQSELQINGNDKGKEPQVSKKRSRKSVEPTQTDDLILVHNNETSTSTEMTPAIHEIVPADNVDRTQLTPPDIIESTLADDDAVSAATKSKVRKRKSIKSERPSRSTRSKKNSNEPTKVEQHSEAPSETSDETWTLEERNALTEEFIKYFERRGEIGEPITNKELADEIFNFCVLPPQINHMDRQLNRYLLRQSVPCDPIVLDAIRQWTEKEKYERGEV